MRRHGRRRGQPLAAGARPGRRLRRARRRPTDALGWLQRATEAARNASYAGTYVHSNGERTSTIRITHVTVNGDEHERIEPLDGPPLRDRAAQRRDVLLFPGREDGPPGPARERALLSRRSSAPAPTSSRRATT